MSLGVFILLALFPAVNCHGEGYQPELKYVAAACGGIAAVSLFDNTIKGYARNLRGSGGRLNETLSDEPVRPESAGLLTAAFFAAGAYNRDQRAMRVATVLPQAWLMTHVSTFLIKKSFGRSRPYLGRGAYKFSLWSSEDSQRSFPSGHASLSFSIAASIATEYDSLWVDVPLYGMASFIALSRVHDDMHWASDVVAGAALGTATAKMLHKFHKSRQQEWALLPAPSGLLLAHKF